MCTLTKNTFIHVYETAIHKSVYRLFFDTYIHIYMYIDVDIVYKIKVM